MSFGAFELHCQCIVQWLHLQMDLLGVSLLGDGKVNLHFLRGNDGVGDFLGGGGGVRAGGDVAMPSKVSSLP